MADINDKLIVTQNNILELLGAYERLEAVVNKDLIRIDDAIIGEENLKDEDKTINNIRENVKKLGSELSGIKSIKIDENNIDSVADRIRIASEQVETLHNKTNQVLEFAAGNILSDFNTSIENSLKSNLNAFKSSMLAGNNLSTNFNESTHLSDLQDRMLESENAELDTYIDDSKKRKEYQRKIAARIYKKATVDNLSDVIDKDLGRANMDTVARAITTAYPKAKDELMELIKCVDQLTYSMGVLTKTKAIENTDIVDLMFGRNIKVDISDKIEEKRQEVEDYKQLMQTEFPSGRKFVAGETIYESEKELQCWYDDYLNELTALENELGSLMKLEDEAKNKVPALLDMYYKGNSTYKASIKYSDVADSIMWGENTWKEDVIIGLSPIKLEDTEEQIKQIRDTETAINELKEKENKLLDNKYLKDAPVTQKIISDENTQELYKNRSKQLENYNKLIQDISNTDLSRSTQTDFDDRQVKNYISSLDSVIKKGNELRESLVKDFNTINGEKALSNNYLDFDKDKFINVINTAKSGIRNNIEDADALQKLKLIDDIVHDIVNKAGNFRIGVSDDVVVQAEKIRQLEVIRERASKFELDNKENIYVEKSYDLQKLEQEIGIFKKLKEIASDTHNPEFNISNAKTYSDIIKELTNSYEFLLNKINDIKQDAKLLNKILPEISDNVKITEPKFYFEKLEKIRDKKIEEADTAYKNQIGKLNSIGSKDASVQAQIQAQKDQAKEYRNTEVRRANDEYNREVTSTKKNFISVIREQERAEQEQTRIAQQEAANRVQAYKDEFDQRMHIFDELYLRTGKRASTEEQLAHFRTLNDQYTNSQNFVGNQDLQKSFVDASLAKVRSLEEQLAYETEKQTQDAEKAVEQTINNIQNKVQQACQFVISVVTKAISIVKWTLNSIGQAVTFTFNAFRAVGSTVLRIISLVGNLANRVRQGTKATNLLKGSWTELNSMISVVSGAINKLTNNVFINEGKKLLSGVESLNTLVGKDLTASTIEWANTLESALGIDASGLVADMREVTGVIKGLGMSAEDAATASKNLVSVGQTMSAVIGLDEQTVMSKIYSGMRGMTTAIDDIGLSVRETQMDSFLKKLKAQGGEYANIGTSFNKLAESQRVYVRYAALMDQFLSVYSAENYAKALESITGRMNILSQRLRALKQLIGNFAIQIFNKYVLPLTYCIDVLTAKLKVLFGSILDYMGLKPEDLELSTGMNHTTVSADDLTESYNKLADAANSAKEATGGLDEMDHVSTLGSSSSSSSSSDSFDYSKLMDLENDYAKKLEDLAKEQEGFYKKKLQEAWDEFKNNTITDFKEWYKEVTGRDFDLDFNLKLNWYQIKMICKKIVNIFKKTFNIIAGLSLSILDDLKFGVIVTKALWVINSFLQSVEAIIDKISPYLMNFYNEYISPYIKEIGRFIDLVLTEANIKLMNFIGNLTNGAYDEAIKEKFEKLAEWFNSTFKPLGEDNNAVTWYESLKKTLDDIINKLKIAWALIGVLFKGEVSEDTEKLFVDSGNEKTLNTVANIFIHIHDILTSVKDIVGQIGADFGLWLQDEGLSDIEGLLGRLYSILSENKDGIISVLEKLGSLAWDLIQRAVNKILDLVEWIGQHSDGINTLLEKAEKFIGFIIDHIEVFALLGLVAKLKLMILPLSTAIAKAMILNNIIGGGTGAVGGIVGAVSTIGTKIAGWFTGMTGKAVAFASTLETKVGGAVSTIGTKISGLFAGASAGGAVAAGAVLTVGAIAGKRGLDDTMDQSELMKAVGKDKKFDTGNIVSQAAATVKRLREIYGDALSDDMYVEAIRTLEEYYRQSGRYTEQEIKHAIDLYTYEIGQYSDSWDLVLSAQGAGWEDWADIVVDNMYTLGDTTEEVAETVSTKTQFMNDSLSSFGNGMWNSEKEISSASTTIQNSLNSVKSTFDSVKSVFEEKITAKFDAVFNANANIDKSKIKWYTGTKTTGLKSFYGHANGGVPKSGSLYMANENGDSELIGNFGGYAGVANQGMILQAMESAVSRGITKAMHGNVSGGNTVINMCQGGVFVGDNSSIRKLASMINNTNRSSNSTIANTGFSMS